MDGLLNVFILWFGWHVQLHPSTTVVWFIIECMSAECLFFGTCNGNILNAFALKLSAYNWTDKL